MHKNVFTRSTFHSNIVIMDFLTVIDWLGRLSTLVVLITVVAGVITWAIGIWPALLRLGNGLARRKIAVFAKGENLPHLKNMLLDSELFSDKNIIEIMDRRDIGRAEKATLFLIFWHDWADSIDDILRQKNDQTALIIYAPQELGSIPITEIKKINEIRNVILSNFRGRLLNDIMISMITTSYEKR